MSRWLLTALFLFPASAMAGSEGLSAVLEQSGSTTTAEKQAFTAAAVEEIGGAVKTVEKLKAEAEKDKNTEAIECLQRKLTPLQTLQDAAGKAASSLSGAAATADVVSVDLHYRRVAVALSKARDFLAEAQACVGDTGSKKGVTNTALDGGDGSEPPLADDVPSDAWDPSPF